MPAKPALATSNGLNMVDRTYAGYIGADTVMMTDDDVSYIPADGQVTKWHFYTRTAGSVGFQVWRRAGTVQEKK